MSESTPAQREAEGAETVTVDWDGVPVTIPGSPDAMDLDALEAFESGKAVSAIKAMVGPKAFNQLRVEYQKANGRKPVVGDLGRLMEAVAVAYGFDTSGN